MPLIEKIIPKHAKTLDIDPIQVNDVEIFRIDFARYYNASRRMRNEKIEFVIKETDFQLNTCDNG